METSAEPGEWDLISEEYIDPCVFWREYGGQLPILEPVARDLLSVPATSAACERLFSKTGHILMPRSRNINDHSAEMLFFLKGNQHLILNDQQ